MANWARSYLHKRDGDAGAIFGATGAVFGVCHRKAVTPVVGVEPVFGDYLVPIGDRGLLGVEECSELLVELFVHAGSVSP